MSRCNATFICCFVLAVIAFASGAAPTCPGIPDTICGTVYVDQPGKYRFLPDVLDPSAAAYGYFYDGLPTIGWGVLEVRAGDSGNYTDDVTSFAAGYLEGIFTGLRIYQNYQNAYSTFFSQQTAYEIKKVMNFFLEQDAWTRSQISMNPTDPYWQHMSYIVSQLDGLIRGYQDNYGHVQPLDLVAFLILSGSGDILDLIPALNPRMRPQFDKMTKQELNTYLAKNTHCSALIKLLPGYEDLFFSHSSWFEYNMGMRIYKYYNLNLQNQHTANRRISFSSYAGYLGSWDDYYVLEHGLVMMETTNQIFNLSLYNLVVPQSLFSWQRVRLSHFMAQNGPQWAKYFEQYNSGTYNNQYMILDLNKIHLSTGIDDDALWIIEQIPGMVVSADQSAILREGHWPSYNVPFYESIFNISGYPSMVAKHGPDYTHDLAPRAKIFRRDQGSVVDMVSFQNLMRYNDYKNDIYSEGNACDSICCRGDLVDGSGQFAGGCYDTKVADYGMALTLDVMAINGPTVSHGLPPFSWDNPAFANISHIGLPATYNFDFVYMKPIFV